MGKSDVSQFFIVALKAEQKKKGHGFQAELARKAGISKTAVNDIIRGRNTGSDRIHRAIAKALGYADYEEFLDLGRQLSGVEPVRSAPAIHKPSTEVPDLMELLVENRSLRLRLEERDRELEAMRSRLEGRGACDPSVREIRPALDVPGKIGG